ncbi:MAG: cyclic dehypoxanthinyl futalosine synthase [Phycisphaerae bacterium]
MSPAHETEGSSPGGQTRVSTEEALCLLRDADTAGLMYRADEFRRRLHGRRTFFVHSLNINPTNVCENRCELCAYWREPDAEDAFVLGLQEARERIEAARDWGLTDVHVVGGLTAELDLAYFESLIRMVRQVLPSALVQGMTAVEIHYLAARGRLAVGDVLRRLKEAGMGAISGGGAEIFAPAVRERICPRKITAEQWLSVHEQAHAIGLATNATMLFGHVEGPEDIVDHLKRLRDLQDRTGGFRAFIPLPFHPAGTRLPVERGPGGHTVARIVALARIFLDNFAHVRVLANYMDRKLLQVLTHGGAADVGGTSLGERIARAAGAPQSHRFASVEEMAAFLEDLSLEPVLTNSAYEGVPPPPAVARQAFSGGPWPARPAPGSNRPPRDRRLTEALDVAEAGRRISAEQAAILHDEAPLQLLGELAHRRRLDAVPGRVATYVLDRNISITNVCESRCRFCAFHVEPGSPDAFALSVEEIVEKVREAAELGATQIMLQGGLSPDLDLPFYEEMLSTIREKSDVWLHSLSPPEVAYLARRSGLSIGQTLRRLRSAGLDSLPGGGAEILVDDVRRRVSPHKITAGEWFGVMEAAHELGMKTTATMVYGLGESTAQRVEHLTRVRDLQDRTGGFTAFIPWSFQPNRTQLPLRPQTGVAYLRIVALARLVLDNVPHIQAGWVTEGPDLAQLALSFGADDFGGVLMEERVVRATGVNYTVTREEVISLIAETGLRPAQRTTQYEILSSAG